MNKLLSKILTSLWLPTRRLSSLRGVATTTTRQSLTIFRDCFATLWSRNDVLTQKGLLKLTKRSLASLLIILTVFIGTGLIYLFGPFAKKTEAVWFNDDWGYRKAIKIWVMADSAKMERHSI